jgi:pectin methylesterase-like acyl-CoA thioesterase
MLVQNLAIDGADSGIRIKSDRSRGGLVHDVIYRDVCIRNVKNPLIFTPQYTTLGGDELPEYRDIALEDIHIESPGSYTLEGLDNGHKLGLNFDNVFSDDQPQSRFTARDAEITVGPRMGNLIPAGQDVTVHVLSGATSGSPLNCDARYVPFPSSASAPELAGATPIADRALYVAADGTGEFSSIQRAIDAADSGGAEISIAPGTYREVLTIDKPHITLRGAGSDAASTSVVNDRSAGADGGTLHSATVNVTADDFMAENITFENDFNRTHPQLPAGSQALALLVTGDRAVFRNIRLLGNQDTVYAGSRNCAPDGTACIAARQFFSHCYIAGNVDFIFGDGKVFFVHCEIHSTAHHGGFVTAQAKHYPEEDSGFVFDHCKLTADPAAEGPIYLGRPWRAYATVIFLNTEMGAHIAPEGWREWHPGETHSLDTVLYAEYRSTGPGARRPDRDPHTRFLTPAESRAYAPQVYLRGSDGWNPLIGSR